MAEHRYLIALGSNVRHPRHGLPPAVLRAAFARLDQEPMALEAASAIFSTAPLGPSIRRYANAAAVVRSCLEPVALLAHLKRIEADFGRRAGGARWRARVLDLDVVLWSGGVFKAPDLTIPHSQFRRRGFVLQPATQIAGHWRDPLTGLTIDHLTARMTRRLDPGATAP